MTALVLKQRRLILSLAARMVLTALFCPATTWADELSASTLPAVPNRLSTRLAGMVLPNGAATTCWFRWGIAGDDYPNTTAPQAAGNGMAVVYVTDHVPPPNPCVQYHCQLVASNRLGLTYGAEQRFGVGTVHAWGSNFHGQSDKPPGLSNVVTIAEGLYHNLALSADGVISAWGYVPYGQSRCPMD